jgi:hypothetical protein
MCNRIHRNTPYHAISLICFELIRTGGPGIVVDKQELNTVSSKYFYLFLK